MKKLLLTLIALWISALMLNPNTAQAQCGCADNFETTFPEAVKAAPVVIEGHAQHAELILFGGEYNDLYTSTEITVYKVLKGNIDAQEVELIAPNISFSGGCSEGGIGKSIGVFMLYPSDVKGSPRTEIALEHKFKYKAAFRIGCNMVNYNAIKFGGGEKGYSPYGIESLKDIKNKIYKIVEKIAQKPYKEMASLPKKAIGGGENADDEKQAVTINSISPTTITAGTFDTLTIRGSGFTPDWLVGFRNPEEYDEEYTVIPDNHYIVRPNNTNDTLYRVLVPSVALYKNTTNPTTEIIIAGTGKIALRKGNTAKKSSQTLTIPYAESTYARSDTSSLIYPVRLARNTPNGDFTFWLHPSVRGNQPILKNKLYSLNA